MRAILLALAAVCLAQAQPAAEKSWDRHAAAAYLDARMGWWAAWAPAARDHDTFCVSCHTSMPYALGRPALRGALSEKEPSASERQFLANIEKRVALWDQVEPFYNDAKSGARKSVESRATEAVLNALVLTRYDAPAAHDALRHMWDLQLKTGDQRGSWTWLNFHNEPWEADDSAFWGASLAALAAGWSNSPEYRDNIALLGAYLQREQASQSTLHRAVALWASGRLPNLLPQEQRKAIAEAIIAKQRDDGGWSASSLVVKDWKRRDGTAMDAQSDGYGTGLMLLALEQSGLPAAKESIAKGRAWLERSQDASGAWLSTSLNKQRDPASDAGKFMNDAATAYSVLALSNR